MGVGLKVAKGSGGFVWSVFRAGFKFHFRLGTSFVATGFLFVGAKQFVTKKPEGFTAIRSMC